MLERAKAFCLFNPCFVLAALLVVTLFACCEFDRPGISVEIDRIVTIEGWISRPVEVLEDYLYFELTPLTVQQDGKRVGYPGRIAVFVSSRPSNKEGLLSPPFAYGDILTVNTFLQDPSYYAIAGVPDYREIYWNRGLLHALHLKSVLQLERKGHHPARALRPIFAFGKRFKQFCKKEFNQEQFKLIISVFLGDKKILENNDAKLIKHLGIFHLFVVSGFHASVLVFFLHLLFQRLGVFGRLLTLSGLWAYIVLVGCSIPALRAGTMITVFYTLYAFGLSAQLLNALGMSALLLLTCSPRSVFSAGFQFSYLCLSIIGLFVLPYGPGIQSIQRAFDDAFTGRILLDRDPVCRLRRQIRFWLEEKLAFGPRRVLPRTLPLIGRVVGYLLALFVCNGFIQLLTLPLTLYYTNRWIWSQWLTNMILVPAFALLIPLCLFLLSTFWLPVNFLAVKATAFWADLLLSLLRGLEAWSWVSYLPHPTPVEMGAFFILFFCGYWCVSGRMRILAFLAPLFLWVILHRPPAQATHPLTITMLDVGQGESLHLRYPNGTDALIDTGGFFRSRGRSNQFVGERLIARYLWTVRSRSLDYVLLSHPHTDHIQGYDFVREAFRTDRLFFYELSAPAIQPSQRLQEGDQFSISGVHHQVLHPPAQARFDSNWTTNDKSLVVKLCYGNFTMLFTGDIEQEAERHLLSKLDRVTVLKAAHHGGRSSNSLPLLLRTRPRLALISAGRKNPFGHPSPATMERFSRAGIPALTTSDWGSLRIETDGDTFRVSHYSIEDRAFQRIPTEDFFNAPVRGD